MSVRIGSLLSIPLVFFGSMMGAGAQESCFGPWQPSIVQYAAPVPPSTTARLIFGPLACALEFDPSWPYPVEVTINGSSVVLEAGLSDTTGVGVPSPAAFIEVPIPPIPPGTYQLQTAFDGGQRILNTTLPLVVAGGAPSPIPINGIWALLVLGSFISLAVWVRLRRAIRS